MSGPSREQRDALRQLAHDELPCEWPERIDRLLDALDARDAELTALADEWDRRYDAGDHMVGCADGSGYYDLLADKLRALLDSSQGDVGGGA